MALKNYYELLGLAPSAPHDEIKRVFRQQIARYHPDKVQHLGEEFQAMAAERAAELTEAYRILSDPGRREEYDRLLSAAVPATSSPAPTPAHATASAPAPSPAADAPPPPPPPVEEPPTPERFKFERATRDEFVRKATMSRFRQALQAVGGGYDESQVRGFDIACVPKGKLFARSKGPRLLGRFVSRVDAEAVAEAWTEAGKWDVTSSDEICIFLMGAAMAPARELAGAIAEQRRKTRAAKVTLIPIDARDWEAHVPTDAPAVAKNLLARLRSGA